MVRLVVMRVDYGQVKHHYGVLGLVLGLVLSLENMERTIKNQSRISTLMSHKLN